MARRPSILGVTIITLFVIIMIILISISPVYANGTQIDEIINKEWIIDSNEQKNDQIIMVDANITVNSMGNLTLINTTLEFNRTTNYSPKFIIDENAKLKMSASKLSNCGIDELNPGLTIFSNEISISECEFSNNYAGLTFFNITNITISKCTFRDNVFGILFYNCSNIRLINCDFSNNTQTAITFIDSGIQGFIELVNCTISQKTQKDNGNLLKLENSKLRIIEVTYNGSISDTVSLDEKSEIIIYWYRSLITIGNKNKRLAAVEITILNGTGEELYSGNTSEIGELGWILLEEKHLVKDGISFSNNPFEIIASKKGYKKETIKLIIKSTNSTPLEIELEKKKSDSGDDLFDSMYMVCLCISVVFLVFIILTSINMRLIRRRMGTIGAAHTAGSSKKSKITLRDSDEFITCSECGSQVTSEATFCPHCGEYFEGDEFACPGCNTILKEADKECPKCGRKFESKSKSKGKEKKKDSKGEKVKEDTEKQGKLFCSECGAVITTSEARCPGCRLLFEDAKGTKETKEKSKKGKVTGENVVAEKHKESSPNKKGKEKRAKRVTAEQEAAGKTEEYLQNGESYMCSICGSELLGDVNKCPKCGTEFE